MTLIAKYSSNNPPFVDVHTHLRTRTAGVFSIPNFSQKDFQNDFFTDLSRDNREGVTSCSVGLHPWFLTKENFENDFEKLSQLASNQQVIAIGECGLDKLRGKDLAFQALVFEQQIRLAEAVSKPVVIHCVRAFGEVIAIKKRLKPTVPLIIHGFNKKASILTELIRHDFFISFGAAILEKKVSNTEELVPILLREGQLAEILRQMPLDRLFFETDDAENVEIQEIYKAASEILKMDLEALKFKIHENAKHVF
jgi:TatD DNase family protein